MADFKDYFSSASADYKQFRPHYPDELYPYLASITPATELAFDVGCGNGQAARALAQQFQQVIASDASAAQIAQTESTANLQFRVAPAEQIDGADSSADLLTVAQAIHWFQHAAFFAEVDRVLKPGGVLAVWGYQLLYTDTALDAVITDFHDNIIGPYWPPERALLDDSYSGITFPYPRMASPDFFMTANWNFSHLLGYLNTWSAVKQYAAAQGENPLAACFDALLSAWGDPQQEKPVYWPLILYLGRKPG